MNHIESDIDTPIQLAPRVVSKIKIQVIDVKLFESVTILVNLLDSNGQLLDNRCFTISGDEYSNWGNDDSYIINLVKSKLGA